MKSISFILIIVLPSYEIVIGYIITKVLTEEVLERKTKKLVKSRKESEMVDIKEKPSRLFQNEYLT